MSDFYNLMGVGFAESQSTIGVTVTANSATKKGVLTPGPFTFTLENGGDTIEVDQKLDVLQSDLLVLGITDLPTACAARYGMTIDGTACRLVSYSQESADPVTTLYLKIAR